MPEDPSRPLKKEEHEEFAKHYAVSRNASQAWQHATGVFSDHSNANGSKWLKNGSIAARVEWLVAEAERRLREVEENSQAPTILAIMEKRLFLARVVRTPIGEVDESSDLCQSCEIDDKGGRKYKMPDKLRAIQLDNDLSGEGSEAKSADALTEMMQRITAERK